MSFLKGGDFLGVGSYLYIVWHFWRLWSSVVHYRQGCIIWVNCGCSIASVLVLSRACGQLEASLGVGEPVSVLWTALHALRHTCLMV